MPCLSLMPLIKGFFNFHCLTRNYTLAIGYSYFQICQAELSLSLYSSFHLMKSCTLFRISILDDSSPGHPVCLNTQHVIFVVSLVGLSWSHVSICAAYSGWEIVIISYGLYLHDCLFNFLLSSLSLSSLSQPISPSYIFFFSLQYLYPVSSSGHLAVIYTHMYTRICKITYM